MKPDPLTAGRTAALDEALAALRRGLSVAWVGTSGDRKPVHKWKRLQAQPATEAELLKYARRAQSGGFACVAGYGDVELLDFDAKHAPGVYLRFEAAARGRGLGDLLDRVKAGYFAATPTDGRHLAYRCQAVGPNQVLAYTADGETAVETRGTGGFFVCPPTGPKVHPAGKPYVQLAGGLGTLARVTPAERDALFAAARGLDESPPDADPPAAAPAPATSPDRPRPDQARAAERAVQYLARVPAAVSGRRGHSTTFAAARAVVYGFDLGPDAGIAMLMEHYNPRCRPPWSEAELRHKCREADEKPYRKPRGWLLAEGTPEGTVTMTAVSGGSPAAGGSAERVSGDSGEEWRRPIPLGLPPAPPFPVDVLPDWLARYVTAVSSTLQTPPDAAAVLSLAAVAGGLAGKLRYTAWNGHDKNANLYVVVAMEPGERKSAVFKRVFAPVFEAERAAAEAARPVIAQALAEKGAMEARLKFLQAQAAKSDDPAGREDLRRQAAGQAAELEAFKVPAVPRYVVDDETPESLARTLIDQGGRVMQAAAEGTAFEIVAGRYSDAENLDVYLKAHDGDPFRMGRVTRGYAGHDRPVLTCGLAVQPDVLRGIGASEKMRGRGFLARWLYAVPDEMVGRRRVRQPPVPPAVAAEYAARLNRVWAAATPDEPAEVRFEPAAADALAAFEAGLEPRLGKDAGDLAGLAGWGSKLGGEVLRLAGTLHAGAAADPLSPGPVTADAVRRAVRLAAEYLIPHVRRAFGVMAADRAEQLAARAAGCLERRPDLATVSRRDLYQWLKGGQSSLKADDLDDPLRILVDHGHLRPAKRAGGPGRPSDEYDINPLWVRGENPPHHPPNPPKTPSAGPTAPFLGDLGDGLKDSGSEPPVADAVCDPSLVMLLHVLAEPDTAEGVAERMHTTPEAVAAGLAKHVASGRIAVDDGGVYSDARPGPDPQAHVWWPELRHMLRTNGPMTAEQLHELSGYPLVDIRAGLAHYVGRNLLVANPDGAHRLPADELATQAAEDADDGAADAGFEIGGDCHWGDGGRA